MTECLFHDSQEGHWSPSQYQELSRWERRCWLEMSRIHSEETTLVFQVISGCLDWFILSKMSVEGFPGTAQMVAVCEEFWQKLDWPSKQISSHEQGRCWCLCLRFCSWAPAQPSLLHCLGKPSPGSSSGVSRSPIKCTSENTGQTNRSNLVKWDGRWENDLLLQSYTVVCWFSVWAQVAQCSPKVWVEVSSSSRHGQ